MFACAGSNDMVDSGMPPATLHAFFAGTCHIRTAYLRPQVALHVLQLVLRLLPHRRQLRRRPPPRLRPLLQERLALRRQHHMRFQCPLLSGLLLAPSCTTGRPQQGVKALSSWALSSEHGNAAHPQGVALPLLTAAHRTPAVSTPKPPMPRPNAVHPPTM